MRKRLLGLLLALVMTLSLLPFGASASEQKSYPATRIGIFEMAYDLFGEPCPDQELPYTDLDGLNEHQLDAVRWAFRNHFDIYGGGETWFGPNDRASIYFIFTLLYRTAGSPEYSATESPYMDEQGRAFPGLLWSAEHDLVEIQNYEKGMDLYASYPDSVIVEMGEDLYSSKFTIKMEHTWDDGVVTKKPTCGSIGEITYTCIGCGMTRTEQLSVHTEWDESTLDALVPATGTSPGYALYHCKNCDDQIILERTPALGDDALAREFKDVPAGQYYAEPVDWAVRRGVTTGSGPDVFAPGETCTRAQVVTFLWRACGCPEPEEETMAFVDVPADAYYADAVLWAVENGITNGTDKTHFSPNDPCTRAHVVTFLWRAEYEGQGGNFSQFVDVRSMNLYYFNAVYWACFHGITNGTDSTHFSPNDPCTRGQVVTFIYRTYSEPVTFIF